MRFALIPANGIGDGLIMLIAAHHLRKAGHEVVAVFHDLLPGLGRWLESGEYRPLSAFIPRSFDAILLQHNNTPLAISIANLRKEGLSIYIFYTTYQPSKHGPLLDGFDYPFDINCTMVENTCLAIQALFGSAVSMSNGLHPLPGLIHRKFPNRVLLHPTSGSKAKNWPRQKYMALASQLKELHFDPVFILSSQEQAEWPEVMAPSIPTLEDLASLIYESGYLIGNDSGPGHLASYLCIPHIIISPSERNMRLWQPGWYSGGIITPSRWIPNFKGLRLREEKWKHFISTRMVLNGFKSIIK